MNSNLSRRDMLRLVGLGAGALGLGGVAACAPSASGPEEDTAKSATNFSFASWSLADNASKAKIEQLMTGYGGKAGISVNGVPLAYNTYLNQLTLQVRGGQFTGAAQMDIAWLAGLAALGKLRDLGDVAKDAGYTEAALTSGQVDGKQVGLPWTTAAIGLIANRELMQKAGVTAAPATIADFEAALRALKGTGVIPYAASTKVAQLKDILIWMQTFGSPLLDGDKVTVGDDASIEAVTWYKKLYDEKLIAPDVERVDARTLFAQGKTAIYDDAIVGRDFVVKGSPDKSLADKLDPLARPVKTAGDKPRAVQWGHAVVVVEGEGANTATDFAKWLTSDEQTVLGYFKDLSLPPTTTKALGSEQVKTDAFTSQFSERITATATPNPFWKYPQYAQMETAISEQVQAVLVGKSKPADAMREAGQAVQALIK
ncbi:extracellular solute-binding protein [Micromonospora sp. WMMD812]|uniref:extracellular solute-binding protein n=1 Tax=Micromonospora sp. WMMD812 TaxID=3015152 RepID=UPI00248C7C0E|nr:extracellular solute-binding protein [Micromonospora sp. WMMD812]WBB69390.1 extracellular solute-binding protein [Micromonospora sp. WMMD812]